MLLLVGALLVISTGCKEEEPPPPSDPPMLSAPEVTCGSPSEAQLAIVYDGYDADVIQTVSVIVEDPQRDYLEETLRGELNGLPLTTLTDDDADLRYVWTAPQDEAPIACGGEIVLRFWVEDSDGNKAELTEIVTR